MRTQLIIILSLLNVCLVPAQERDTRVRTYITPTRIVWQQDSDHLPMGLVQLFCLISGKNFMAEYN